MVQYDKSMSQIEKSANIRSPEGICHPVSIGHRAEVHVDVQVGAFSFINTDTIIYRNTKIGRFCSIARGCEIGAANHPTTMLSSHSFQYSNWMFPKIPEYQFKRNVHFLAHAKTTIGSDVWIGAQAIVRAGATIGHGAIVAGNSVVTKDVPPYTIVGGSPAKIIRLRFPMNIAQALLDTAWWELPFEQICTLPFNDVEACVAALLEIRRDNPRESGEA